jgi:hypothetical protein
MKLTTLKSFIRRHINGEPKTPFWNKADQERLDRTTADLDRLLEQMRALTGERR